MTATGRAPLVAIAGVRRARTGLGRYFAKHLVKHGAVVPAFLGTSAETIAEARKQLAEDGIDAVGFTSLPALLRAVPIDALVIASPHETHAELLQQALPARLSVLCEKPLVWGVGQPADRAAELVREFQAAGLVLFENCQWPFALPAFDALHPIARRSPPKDFAMWLSPSAPGTTMLLDSMSHPISLLQELTGADESSIENVSFSTRDLAASHVEVEFRFLGGGERVQSFVTLHVVKTQPRPAGFVVNGFAAERQVRMSDYALSLVDGPRSVPLPDPMEEMVRRFVVALCSGVAEIHERRNRRRITDRMRMLEHLVGEFTRRR